jgi:hypothetical protein
MGINPASGRYAGTMADMRLSGAGLVAGAMTRGRLDGERELWGRRSGLAGLYSGMAGQGASLALSGASGEMAAAERFGGVAADAAETAYRLEDGKTFADEITHELEALKAAFAQSAR